MVGFTNELDNREVPAPVVLFAFVPLCIGFLLATLIAVIHYYPVYRIMKECEQQIERSRSCVLVAVAGY